MQNASTPCPDDGPAYGLQPHVSAAIAQFASDVTTILETRELEEVPDLVAKAIEPLLSDDELLAEVHRGCAPDGYCRHLLYADPKGRFTLLALVWRPGQGSPVHGHTAWCSVGIWRGETTITTYRVEEPVPGSYTTEEDRSFVCGPGEICALQPGLQDVHRLANMGDEVGITLHVYGKDLVADPCSINQVVSA